MALTAVEIGTRSPQHTWSDAAQRERNFQRALPAVIFAAVSRLAQEHEVTLRSVQVIERKPKPKAR